MSPYRSPLLPHAPRAIRVLAGLLVLVLLVAAQNLHAPVAHADGGESPVAAEGGHVDGHDHGEDVAGSAHPSEAGGGACAGSICALCLALTPDSDPEPERAESSVPSTPVVAAPHAPVERLYRPPILPV